MPQARCLGDSAILRPLSWLGCLGSSQGPSPSAAGLGAALFWRGVTPSSSFTVGVLAPEIQTGLGSWPGASPLLAGAQFRG